MLSINWTRDCFWYLEKSFWIVFKCNFTDEWTVFTSPSALSPVAGFTVWIGMVVFIVALVQSIHLACPSRQCLGLIIQRNVLLLRLLCLYHRGRKNWGWGHRNQKHDGEVPFTIDARSLDILILGFIIKRNLRRPLHWVINRDCNWRAYNYTLCRGSR